MRSKQILKMTDEQRDRAKNALKVAVEVIGSQTKFAKMIDTHQSQVNRWINGLEVPAERAVLIEKEVGIEREILRPDIFIK